MIESKKETILCEEKFYHKNTERSVSEENVEKDDFTKDCNKDNKKNRLDTEEESVNFSIIKQEVKDDSLLNFLNDLSRTLQGVEMSVSCSYFASFNSPKEKLYISTNKLSVSLIKDSKELNSIRRVLENLKEKKFKNVKSIDNYLPFIETLMAKVNSIHNFFIFDSDLNQHKNYVLWYFKNKDPSKLCSYYDLHKHFLTESVQQIIFEYVNCFNRLINSRFFDEIIINNEYELIPLERVHCELKILEIWWEKLIQPKYFHESVRRQEGLNSEDKIKVNQFTGNIEKSKIFSPAINNIQGDDLKLTIGTSTNTCKDCDSLFSLFEKNHNIKIIRRTTHGQPFRYHENNEKVFPKTYEMNTEQEKVFNDKNIDSHKGPYELENHTNYNFVEFSDLEETDITSFEHTIEQVINLGNRFPGFFSQIMNSLNEESLEKIKNRKIISSTDKNNSEK